MFARRLLLAVALLGAGSCLLVPNFSAGQSITSGDITGTVTDPSGAIVPSAAVTITNPLTKETKTGTTNQAGVFRFALVQPGNYILTVAAPGFQTTTRTLLATVGQVTRADTSLTVGPAS